MDGPAGQKALLDWYFEAGVDETIGDKPVNRFNSEKTAAQMTTVNQSETGRPVSREAISSLSLKSRNEAVHTAQEIAAAASNIEELHNALEEFDGCPLKETAMKAMELPMIAVWMLAQVVKKDNYDGERRKILL